MPWGGFIAKGLPFFTQGPQAANLEVRFSGFVTPDFIVPESSGIRLLRYSVRELDLDPATGSLARASAASIQRATPAYQPSQLFTWITRASSGKPVRVHCSCLYYHSPLLLIVQQERRANPGDRSISVGGSVNHFRAYLFWVGRFCARVYLLSGMVHNARTCF